MKLSERHLIVADNSRYRFIAKHVGEEDVDKVYLLNDLMLHFYGNPAYPTDKHIMRLFPHKGVQVIVDSILDDKKHVQTRILGFMALDKHTVFMSTDPREGDLYEYRKQKSINLYRYKGGWLVSKPSACPNGYRDVVDAYLREHYGSDEEVPPTVLLDRYHSKMTDSLKQELVEQFASINSQILKRKNNDTLSKYRTNLRLRRYGR